MESICLHWGYSLLVLDIPYFWQSIFLFYGVIFVFQGVNFPNLWSPFYYFMESIFLFYGFNFVFMESILFLWSQFCFSGSHIFDSINYPADYFWYNWKGWCSIYTISNNIKRKHNWKRLWNISIDISSNIR